MTSKEKIDQILGIESGESIDDFLDGLTIDKTDEMKDIVSNIDDNVKANLQSIDSKMSELQQNSVIAPTILVDINSSMKEVEDLIQLSKAMFKHIYEAIITCELVDSELVQAASKLLESIHVNIQEFLGFYRDKAKYIERIKIMTFQQEQKKELMALKHKYDMEKLQNAQGDAIETEGKMMYSVEEITKVLNKMDV